MYIVAYRGANKLVIAVTNDFSWVQTTKRDDDLPRSTSQHSPSTGSRSPWASATVFRKPAALLSSIASGQSRSSAGTRSSSIEWAACFG
jgi:hypothetical protein